MKKTVLLVGILLGAMMILTACNGDDYDANANGAEDAPEIVEGVPEAPPTPEMYAPDYVEAGDMVSVEYEGRLSNGDVFDSSAGRAPLTFIAGVGQMIPGFDAAVLGMALNEEKTVTIPADEAYGAAGVADPMNPDEYIIPPNEDITFDIKIVDIQRPVQP